MAKTSKRQLEYAKKHEEKLRQFKLRLHKENDAELIDKLEGLPKGEMNQTMKQALSDYFKTM